MPKPKQLVQTKQIPEDLPMPKYEYQKPSTEPSSQRLITSEPISFTQDQVFALNNLNLAI
jgi:hypothetical protein